MASHPLRPVTGSPAEVWAALRSWWVEPDGPVIVRTAGSTGAARDVVLSHRALLASARAAQARLGGPGTWLLDLPVTTVAGLQVLVRSLLAGTEPVLATGTLAAAAAQVVGRVYTSLVPTQLHRLDRAGHLGQLASLTAVLVGGSAVGPDLLERARDAGVRVVQTYGMSETCGGCVYDGVALDGVGLRIAADEQIEISGPVLFDGYRDDPVGTAAVLRDGWLRTGDLGRLDGGGRLRVSGRADDVVLSGGVAVHLLAVESAVRTHRDVAEVAVAGVDDDEWGSRIVAVVVPNGEPPSLANLRDHVAAAVPRTWAPRRLVVVAALPTLPGGKVDRLRVRSLGSEAGVGQG